MTKENDVILIDGPEDSATVFVMAHGAGAPMDAPFMTAFAEGLSARGICVVRFEFDYMRRRRDDGKRRPPERAEKLLAQFRTAIAGYDPASMIIGGKSMGGRMASLLLAETPDIARGCVCLGYPFHPPGKPDKLRTEHLRKLSTPALICQGERDALGNREEVAGYEMSPSIRLHWLADGNHDLTPRKRSGYTQDENWTSAMDAIADFVDFADFAARTV